MPGWSFQHRVTRLAGQARPRLLNAISLFGSRRMASSKSLIALSYSCLGRTLAAVHAVTELVKLRDARVEGEGARSAVGEAAVHHSRVSVDTGRRFVSPPSIRSTTLVIGNRLATFVALGQTAKYNQGHGGAEVDRRSTKAPETAVAVNRGVRPYPSFIPTVRFRRKVCFNRNPPRVACRIVSVVIEPTRPVAPRRLQVRLRHARIWPGPQIAANVMSPSDQSQARGGHTVAPGNTGARRAVAGPAANSGVRVDPVPVSRHEGARRHGGRL